MQHLFETDLDLLPGQGVSVSDAYCWRERWSWTFTFCRWLPRA